MQQTPPSTPVQTRRTLADGPPALNGSRRSSSPLSASPSAPPLIPFEPLNAKGSMVTSDVDSHVHYDIPTVGQLPSYSYAFAQPGLALLPALSIDTPPASPHLNSEEADPLINARSRSNGGSKRKAGAMHNEEIGSDHARKLLKTSPALRNLSIFTKAAFAEEQSQDSRCRSAPACWNANLPSEEKVRTPLDMDAAESGLTRMNLKVLVSDLPGSLPYPPTPRSMSLPALTFSSDIQAQSGSRMDSPAFHDEIRFQVSETLGLNNFGLGLHNIDLFPRYLCHTGGDRKDNEMTVVLHTA